ncbi:RPA-interacting protein B-like [Anneissia japonica]|uniref:RPA-interacting protein B-like n=1 Tax=Anneissia japonica TaxID=1529436 RepID=UPI0014257338|nr:RPA-interacting protein B-like [Anneissia japonica]
MAAPMEVDSSSKFSSPTSAKWERDHRALYKATTPPSWKETYRKRCLQRLRKSRDNLLDRLRCSGAPMHEGKLPSVVTDVMEKEWRVLRAERRCTDVPDLVEGIDDIDTVLSIMEEIQHELMKEEQSLLSEYEAHLKHEEEVLCASVAKMNTDEVTCPICKRNALMENKGVIFCACGVRIQTEQDCLTLNNVKQQLSDGVEQHSSTMCLGQPIFSVGSLDMVGSQNLLMACKVCDFLHVVI